MDQYPSRKHAHLQSYDYGANGYYHIVICTENHERTLGVIRSDPVGRGLAPAAPRVELTPRGETAERQLYAITTRFPGVRVDQYIIMPSHIHAVIIIESAGANPRPTLMDVVGAFKSLSTRECNQRDGTPGRKIWQTSFYDEVIRNERAYQRIWQYIELNAKKALLRPSEW